MLCLLVTLYGIFVKHLLFHKVFFWCDFSFYLQNKYLFMYFKNSEIGIKSVKYLFKTCLLKRQTWGTNPDFLGKILELWSHILVQLNTYLMMKMIIPANFYCIFMICQGECQALHIVIPPWIFPRTVGGMYNTKTQRRWRASPSSHS